jgi:hypothetical protein
MDILHRANTIEMVRGAVPMWQRFEIDIQCMADGTLVVYHDDVEDGMPTEAPPTFEEFLQGMPDGIHIVVETKVYKNAPNVDKILRLCAAYPNLSYTFSTFHRPTYEVLLEKGQNEAWLLLCDLESYRNDDPRICVDKKLLGHFDPDHHREVYVYDVSACDLEGLKQQYPFVKGWIVDI